MPFASLCIIVGEGDVMWCYNLHGEVGLRAWCRWILRSIWRKCSFKPEHEVACGHGCVSTLLRKPRQDDLRGSDSSRHDFRLRPPTCIEILHTFMDVFLQECVPHISLQIEPRLGYMYPQVQHLDVEIFSKNFALNLDLSALTCRQHWFSRSVAKDAENSLQCDGARYSERSCPSQTESTSWLCLYWSRKKADKTCRLTSATSSHAPYRSNFQ